MHSTLRLQNLIESGNRVVIKNLFINLFIFSALFILIYMIGFFIKKAFFDGWDNLLGMVLYNLGAILFFFLGWYSLGFGDTSPLLAYSLAAVALLLFSIYMGGVSHVTHAWANYEHDSWTNFKLGIKRNIRHSILYFFINVLMLSLAIFVIPFYFSMTAIAGLIIGVLLVWIELALLLAFCYYWTMTELLPGDRPLKTLKKCFVVLVDNLGFSIFFALYRAICGALTIFTMGLVPGGAGLELAHQVAGKLLMLKYDYLEENPEVDRRHLPWCDIIYEENEKVGPRSFKSMIFPWK